MKKIIYFMCMLFMMVVISKAPVYATELEVVETITAHKRTEGALKKEEITITDVLGEEVTIYLVDEYQYDELGRLVWESDERLAPNPTITTYTYDENGRLLQKKTYISLAKDIYFESIYQYDKNGNSIETKVIKQGGTIIDDSYCSVTHRTYDAYGKILKIVNSEVGLLEGLESMDISEIDYDKAGNIIRVSEIKTENETQIDRRETTIIYNEFGNAIKFDVIGYNEIAGEFQEEIIMEYDYYGNVTQKVKTEISSNSVFFLLGCENDECTVMDMPAEQYTVIEQYKNQYDEHGRLTQVITTGTTIEEEAYICTKYTY